MSNLFYISIGIVLCLNYSECKKLPNYIEVCHRNDPQISRCMKNSINKAKPFMASGMTELGVIPLEPVHAYNVFSSQPAGPSKSVMMSVGTIEIYGCTNFVIRELTMDMENKKLTYEAIFPEIFVSGEYNASGWLVFIPVSGNGKLTANYTNTVAKFIMGWDIVTKDDNQEYMEAKTMEMHLTVNSAKNVYFENFLSEEKTLSEFINIIINYGISNAGGFWNLMSNEILKGAEEKLAPIFMWHLNELLGQYSYDEMFPAL